MHKYSYKQISGIVRFNSNVNNVFACLEQNFIITANKSCLRRDGEVRHINVNSTGFHRFNIEQRYLQPALCVVCRY